jgi:hypothetical protein
VGGIRQRRQRRQVVEPIQVGLVCSGIETADEEVNVVGVLAAISIGGSSASLCRGGEEVPSIAATEQAPGG